jgi:N12 class adenine-specific DNA methylase
MDKLDPAIRAELAKQCDLVSAIRMPDTTHKDNAGTEVVTDMLVLRKRLPGEKPSGPDWMGTVEVPCPRSTSNPDGGEPIVVNRYFADHPEQVLGELNRTGKLYGGDQKNVSRTDDYQEKLDEAVASLPQNIMSQPKKSKAFEPESMPAPGNVRPGGFAVQGGKLYRHEEGRLVQQEANAKNLERIQGHMAVRDATRAVINAQTSGQDATQARAELNEAYDEFVAKHGPLNSVQNKRAFRGDPDGPLLLALEKWNNESKTAAKSDMFTKDTIKRVAPVERADNLTDALGACLHERGRVDVDHVAKLVGQDGEAVKRGMVQEGIAFEDPSEGFQSAAHYLSGNVRRKLAIARAAAASDPKYQANVEALEKVQPEDVDHTDISARLGANWIPATDITDFAAHLLSGNRDDFDIKYVPQTGDWNVYYTNKGKRGVGESAAANSVWGVEVEASNGQKRHVAGFLDVLKAALSGRSMTIKTSVEGPDGKEKEVVDVEATDACRAKVQELKDAFCGENGDGWVWEDDARRGRLHRYYNDNFNNIRQMQYDGAHLKFPGMNPAFKMRDYQSNFVWQVVTTGKGLAAHDMGTGKTATMIASAMELRRLGLAKKPCIACLKSNVEAITQDVLKLYPGARVLSTADMFTADKRKKTISQIATGDYDIVVMTHDNMNMLQMRPETQAKYINEELDELRAAKAALEEEDAKAASTNFGRRRGKGGGNKHSVKALEKAEMKLQAKLKEALASEGKDDAVYFEDLGIDQLFVDEAHKFKTLPVYTKKDRVKGIPTGRSQRATSMLMRTRWLQEQHGGRGVVFATGTPISNTMTELYTMQRYLQPEALKERNIDKFDAWANLFGDEQTKMEFTVAGEYKPTTRFSKFVNIPELMQIARQVIDVRDTPASVVRPNRHDHVVAAPQTDRQANFMKSLKDRAEQARKVRPGTPGADNMLNICTDGRKGALDLRLVDPHSPDDPQSKTNLAVANIVKIAKENPGQAQLIFSDVGVNPMKLKGGENSGGGDDDDRDLDEPSDLENDAVGLRWYGDVIDKLVKGGIPREKIADFSKLKDQAKEDAQAALRRGDMLVGIGSTQKMGTGVNIQDRVKAMHHLDVPWVPADIAQRDARGWRHGNQNKDIDVYRYVTEGSLDQTFWQTVGTKANFINQIMRSGSPARSVENVDTEQLTPEQLMAAASGDPRVMEKVSLDEELKQLRRAQVRHDKEQVKLKRAHADTTQQLADLAEVHAQKTKDAEHLAANPDFQFAIGDTAHAERKDAEEALASSIKAAEAEVDRKKKASPYSYYSSREEQPIGAYRGMDVFRAGPVGGGTVFIRTPNGHVYPTSGTVQGIESIARRIQGSYAQETAKKIDQAKNDLVKVGQNIGKAFPKAAELKEKAERVKRLEEMLAPKKEEDEPKPGVSMSQAASIVDPLDVSEDVRAEALRNLRAMFPLSDYADLSGPA